MAPSSRYFQRALDVLLALDVGKVARIRRRVRVQVEVGPVRLDGVVVAKVRGQPAQRVYRVDVDALHQRGLWRIGLRHEHRLVAQLLRQVGHRQQPVDMAQRAVERQLAQEQAAVQVRRDLLSQHEQGDCDGQVVRRALLAQVGGREVDRHPAARVVQAGVNDGRAHAFGGLFDRGVGQADERDRGQGFRVEVGLHLDDGAVEADERATVDFGKHGRISWQG